MSGNGNSENNKNLYSKVQSHFSESSQHYYPLKHHATWPDSIRISPGLPHSSIMALRFTYWTPERLHPPPPPHLLLPPSLRHLPRAFSLFTGTDRCDLGILINVGISSMNWLFWTDSLDWCIMSSAWTFLFWALVSLFSFRGSKFLRFEKKW